ncbi:MAG: isoaspartyl peptidase/L-asparaginase [Acidobacteria bacterium]|nr:isoaspartyl peptidase/L-asparaginase [Acidobacteriota bacterium]
MARIALVVHGGAWEIPAELAEACRQGVRSAVDRGWAVLARGGSAIDACEQAIIELEDEPVFDAGAGSHLNRDGKVQLDAILMNGSTLKSGAVVAVERVRNPIRLARLVLEKSDHMMLAAPGAEQFARENGLELCDPRDLIVEREKNLWAERSGTVASMGTVGAVAVDASGDVAAGTSTGGTFFKYPGRVGDSPLVGCGCYADNLASAVSTTGHGESIMKVVLAKTANDLVAAGRSPQEAADAAISILSRRTEGQGGLIVVDRSGRMGFAFSTPHMAYAFRSSSDYGIWKIR